MVQLLLDQDPADGEENMLLISTLNNARGSSWSMPDSSKVGTACSVQRRGRKCHWPSLQVMGIDIELYPEQSLQTRGNIIFETSDGKA